MKILILGGTSDARKVVAELEKRDLLKSLQVTYSVAGLVRVPEFSCEVISGGFTQRGGLTHYLRELGFDLVIDITHPFALQMSTAAVAACAELAIPCWRFHRSAWQAQEGDQWQLFDNWDGLIKATEPYRSIFLTAGQIEKPLVDQFKLQAELTGQRQIIRTAAPPKAELPETMQWLKAIGPFNHADEKQLLIQYDVDLLVSKNSGGSATEAKLAAARELGVPVFMLERPQLPASDCLLDSVNDVVNKIENKRVGV
ncbi:precorrin-6A/cobalt-precorrin-6A reductase [Neptuniibacter sp. 2_MG-2023]|uniref:precorrin-6A/cobalt-precorrin-6A reductase n=1 Tax=Neptuniibacter sp. 2_MG-2023 TaxID=3062671 RepID=UPI0026E219E3|nr:precorrin-6A/cobalt-precorrin-6A reductase [Neptuniibacter sp. 2_MG-2023]MDO6512547.1 precorrin-6A/cobalt-precorrin-6A reductase [Neptuniibacter sp. 2_MG-2023]